MNLRSFSIVFVLAGKVFAFEAVQDLGNRLCWLRQHRLQGYTRLQFTIVTKIEDSVLKHCGDDDLVAREFAVPNQSHHSVQDATTHL